MQELGASPCCFNACFDNSVEGALLAQWGGLRMPGLAQPVGAEDAFRVCAAYPQLRMGVMPAVSVPHDASSSPFRF